MGEADQDAVGRPALGLADSRRARFFRFSGPDLRAPRGKIGLPQGLRDADGLVLGEERAVETFRVRGSGKSQVGIEKRRQPTPRIDPKALVEWAFQWEAFFKAGGHIPEQ